MIGRLRSVSGCVLLAYVVTHLSNHALALWSLSLADAGLEWLSAVWRWPPVTVLLLTAFLVHLCMALHSLWRRRTWRMSRWEWAQLLLGLSILPLGMTHVIGTRVAHELHGVYTNHFWVLWPMAVDPWQNARQCALVIAVTQLVTPGPAVAIATPTPPGPPSCACACAMCTAAPSSRTSTMRTPRRCSQSQIGWMWPPCRP